MCEKLGRQACVLLQSLIVSGVPAHMLISRNGAQAFNLKVWDNIDEEEWVDFLLGWHKNGIIEFRRNRILTTASRQEVSHGLHSRQLSQDVRDWLYVNFTNAGGDLWERSAGEHVDWDSVCFVESVEELDYLRAILLTDAGVNQLLGNSWVRNLMISRAILPKHKVYYWRDAAPALEVRFRRDNNLFLFSRHAKIADWS